MPNMAAAWPAGRASPAAGPPGLLRTLWLVTVAAGHCGAAASGAVGGEETPKCEDLRVGQYPPESRRSQAVSWTRGLWDGDRGFRCGSSDQWTPGGEEGCGDEGRAPCAFPGLISGWHFLFRLCKIRSSLTQTHTSRLCPRY